MQPSTDRLSTDQVTERRVTVVEAATILSITPDAVRSRLRRGTLQKDQAQDGTVLVVLEDDGRDRPDASSTDRPTDQTTVAYIASLKSQIEYLKQTVPNRDEKIRRRDHLLAAALERIPAIEAPASHETSESPESAGEGSGEGDMHHQRRSGAPGGVGSWARLLIEENIH